MLVCLWWWWWWLWLCSLVHSAAWCWTPPLLHCFPCHELVFSVFPGRGLSPWHETKGSHSQGPQATQVCSSPRTLPCLTVPTQWPVFSFTFVDLFLVAQQILLLAEMYNIYINHMYSFYVSADGSHDLVWGQCTKTILLFQCKMITLLHTWCSNVKNDCFHYY